MASPKLSSQDKKDMDKFAKYLVYKCIQIIVQSRLGEKVKTQSKPFSSGSDWYNLAIKDIPEVSSETKKVFSTGSLSIGQYVCVEISLKTAEGETMILETWWLTMTDTLDPNARVSYTVYNRMGVLLKSLFCLSRVTPAYKLSRRQGPETFVICYRVYLGDPLTNHLGNGCEKVRVGVVPSPVGTITLHVAYRTKMLISPHQSTRDLSVDLKDDHFNSENSPGSKRPYSSPKACRHQDKENRIRFTPEEQFINGGHAMRGAFASSPEDQCDRFNGRSVSPPYRHFHHQRPSEDNSRVVEHGKTAANGFQEREGGFTNNQRLGAFAPYKDAELQPTDDVVDEDDDVPFGTLLQPNDPPVVDSNANQKAPNGHQMEPGGAAWENDASGSTTSESVGNRSTHSVTSGSGPEDFVMVELKTPFAGPESNSDLGRFYRECQGAPPLSMFQDTVSVQDTLNSITDQLAQFEAHARDFDDFVNTLQEAAEG